MSTFIVVYSAVDLFFLQVKSLVGEELFSRYDRLLLQSSLDLMSGEFRSYSNKPEDLFKAATTSRLFVSCLSSFLSRSDVTYCPRLSCGSPVLLEKSSNAAVCSVCNFAFCVNCRKTYHGAGECVKKIQEKQIREIVQEGANADLPQSKGTRPWSLSGEISNYFNKSLKLFLKVRSIIYLGFRQIVVVYKQYHKKMSL